MNKLNYYPFIILMIFNISCEMKDLEIDSLEEINLYYIDNGIYGISVSPIELIKKNDFENEYYRDFDIKLSEISEDFMYNLLDSNIKIELDEYFLNSSNENEILIREFYNHILSMPSNKLNFGTYDIEFNKETLRVLNESYEIADITYIPSVLFYNLEYAINNDKYIVAIGSEIKSEYFNENETEDFIPGWLCENKECNYILINESFANSTNIPIYIVANSEEIISLSDIDLIDNRNFNDFGKFMMNKNCDLTNYSIKYRYDNNNYSEYDYVIGYVFSNSFTTAGGNSTRVRKIHKNDLNKIFTDRFNIWQLDYVSDPIGFFLVTFEYDWYATRKDVVLYHPGVGNGGYLYAKAKMKFAHEYYQRIYFDLSLNRRDLNEKGSITIIKN